MYIAAKIIGHVVNVENKQTRERKDDPSRYWRIFSLFSHTSYSWAGFTFLNEQRSLVLYDNRWASSIVKISFMSFGYVATSLRENR